jgi:hypothetical protein
METNKTAYFQICDKARWLMSASDLRQHGAAYADNDEQLRAALRYVDKQAATLESIQP